MIPRGTPRSSSKNPFKRTGRPAGEVHADLRPTGDNARSSGTPHSVSKNPFKRGAGKEPAQNPRGYPRNDSGRRAPLQDTTVNPDGSRRVVMGGE